MTPILYCPTKRTLLLFIVGIVALSIGGWIYVVGRPNTYIYGLWHAHIATTQTVNLPSFVLYSLPGALWSLSSILMLHSILYNELPGRRLTIIAVVPLLGIISEFLQGMGCLPGMFDIYDLVGYAIPLLSYIFFQSYHNFSIFKS